MKCAWVLLYEIILQSFIIICFASFAERILPISTAALLASELPLDYTIQRKKNANNPFLFGFF